MRVEYDLMVWIVSLWYQKRSYPHRLVGLMTSIAKGTIISSIPVCIPNAGVFQLLTTAWPDSCKKIKKCIKTRCLVFTSPLGI